MVSKGWVCSVEIAKWVFGDRAMGTFFASVWRVVPPLITLNCHCWHILFAFALATSPFPSLFSTIINIVNHTISNYQTPNIANTTHPATLFEHPDGIKLSRRLDTTWLAKLQHLLLVRNRCKAMWIANVQVPPTQPPVRPHLLLPGKAVKQAYPRA
jgi:hypothetical protein